MMEIETKHHLVITLTELEASRLLRYLNSAQSRVDAEALDVAEQLTRRLRQALTD